MPNNPAIKDPSFPTNYDKSRSKMPSDNPAGKIPAKTEIKPFAGLPASQSPRPLAIEKGNVKGDN
jgi:hypothetical protein